ncbi:MAG: VOC family protein [Candidatus Gastranaerophilales bacterium]|nr:VOC family protein [Candidatus Gastranaerophilales bacterium]
MQFLHSMIRVLNEEKSIKFYCELLGLKKGERIRLEDCYLQYLVDEKTGVQIELTINDEVPVGGYSLGDSFGHFAFLCDDLDEISKKIEKLGYSWDVEPFYMDEIKTRISFINDPDGNSIELIEKAY